MTSRAGIALRGPLVASSVELATEVDLARLAGQHGVLWQEGGAGFAGVESAPIRFERNGVKWSVTAGKVLDMAAEGAMGLDPNAKEPLHLDNTGHPANNRFALAHASRSHVHALGFDWDDDGGRNNKKKGRKQRKTVIGH